MFLLTIYPPWLLNMFPYSYWASTCIAALPTYSAFMISVRQAGDLPPASFRFPVTRDTLALGYILPAVGRIRDFHPLKHAPAGRTTRNPGRAAEAWPGCIVSGICPLNTIGDFQQLLRSDILGRKMEYNVALRVSPCNVRTGREREHSVDLHPLPNNVSA